MLKKSIHKKTLVILLLMFVTVLLFGCSNSSNGGSNDSNSKGTAPAGQKYVIKLGHDHMVNSPFQKSALKFKELIEERSDGRMEVEIYPAQQLGSSREMIEAMQMGSLEMTLLPTAKYGGFDMVMTLPDMPFLFPNEDLVWDVLEGDLGKEMMSGLDDIGIKGLQFFAEGFKCFTSNEPIEGVDFFKGKKWRTMEAPVIIDMYKAWGANPVPIDFSEVYNSLQQGVVDGHENPFLSIHDMKFYEVQKYITISEHAYLSYFMAASKKWFDSLPEDLQTIVLDTTMDVAQYHKELMDEANKTYLQDFKNFGNVVVELTESQKEEFRKASQPVYDKYKGEFGSILDRTMKYIEENK